MTPKGKLSKEELMRLADACIQALIQGNYRASVDIIVPINTKFHKGMPRGMLVKDAVVPEGYQQRVILVQKLLKWLHKRGYSKWSYDEVEYHKKCAREKMKAFERDILRNVDVNKFLDVENEQEYNDDINLEN